MASTAAHPQPARPAERARERWIASGLLAIGLAVYPLTGPGRIDMTDGQWRYEVASGLVEEGRPVVRDPRLLPSALRGRGGARYSAYGAGGSVAGAPLVWLGSLAGDRDGELRRFLFSHTSAGFAAALLPLLYLFLRDLGVARRVAAGWSAATGFATLLWPLATSTFDQAQHALLVLAALWLAHRSARDRSTRLAGAGGLVAGLLLSYQEVYAVLLPALAIACRADPTASAEDQAAGRRRSLLFIGTAALGLLPVLLFNQWRFETPFVSGKLAPPPGHPSPLGVPPLGLWGLLASPGKSVFLYSPPTLLALAGIAGLWRRHRRLAQAVLFLAALHLALVSSLSFWAGEWSWGPRYLVPLLAPLALALPYLPRSRLRRPVAATAVGAGLVVQLLALAVDHQRFFFERRLRAYFWDGNYSFYLDNSQLLARPREIARSLAREVDEAAIPFQPTPLRGSITYCMFGSPEALTDSRWVDRFPVFHLPRPWPLWMPRLERSRLPLSPLPAAAALLLLGVAGAVAMGRGLWWAPSARTR